MMGNKTPRPQAERIACRTENYPAIAESHPVAGETASGYSCATTSVVIVAPALRRVWPRSGVPFRGIYARCGTIRPNGGSPEPYAAHSWGVSAATEAPPDGRRGGPCSAFRPRPMHFTLTLTLKPPLSPTTWSSQKSDTHIFQRACNGRLFGDQTDADESP